jgi:hypothetical protein
MLRGMSDGAQNSRGHDPWAHRRGEPRTFAAAWVAFLFGGLALTLLSVGSLGLVATDVYRAAARVIVAICVVATWVFWPMIRLSQSPPRRVVGAFGADWVLVVLPTWAIIWPQTFAWMAGWSAEVCMALSLLVTGWAAWAAAMLTWYFGRVRVDEALRPARWVVMLLVVLAVWVGPLVSVVIARVAGRAEGAFDLAGMFSPVGGAMQLVADQSAIGAAAIVSREQWIFIFVLLASGLLAWGLSALAAREAA